VASPFAGTPVREALDSALVALTAAEVDSPRLDAELLLAHALGVDRAALYVDRDLSVGGAAARTFRSLVHRRAVERAPIAYLLGRKGFRHLELTVDERVLVPRPETELLVEVALGLPQGARVVDVGTGSGAVALALKHERPDLDVVATDTSAAALAVARENAHRLGLDVAFEERDLFEGEFDAVLSNPPYVADGDALPPDVARHEPHEALFAGPDGLATIRRLVDQVRQRGQTPPSQVRQRGLTPSLRFVAIEVGAGQAGAVGELLRGAGFPDVEAREDLAGIERVVVARC
jgi:release factor glutamine methyltransferase